MDSHVAIHIAHMAGTILTSEVQRFKRLLFRTTKGKALPHFHEIEQGVEDIHGKLNMKTVYVVVFEDGERIRQRVTKICDSFMGQRFSIEGGDFQTKISETESNIVESGKLLTSTIQELKKYMEGVNETGTAASRFSLYTWYLKKEQSLYMNLNKLKRGDQLFLGFFWVATSEVPKVMNKFSELREKKNMYGPQIAPIDKHSIKPPTLFKTNAVTGTGQLIVDTYGVPAYKEANPAVFTIVTFPFMFGVMYGDIGHGFLLMALGIYLVMRNDSIEKSDSFLKYFLSGRYFLMMMGFFAFYCGWIYNDFMSIPIELFSSCWSWTPQLTTKQDATPIADCVYPFGIDWAWYDASNELTFMNGLKMKYSVIIGVSQMLLGILLKGINAVYFRRWLDFFFEFIPQFVLLASWFGFMDLMIIWKWNTYYPSPSAAPSIITLMINMFLNFGAVPQEEGDPDPLLVNASVQSSLSVSLLVIGFICVPLMLLVKPITLNFMHKKSHVEDVEQEPKEQVELGMRSENAPLDNQAANRIQTQPRQVTTTTGG